MVGDMILSPSRVDRPGFYKWLITVRHGCYRDGWCSEVVGIDHSQDISSFRAPSGALLFGHTYLSAVRCATLNLCRFPTTKQQHLSPGARSEWPLLLCLFCRSHTLENNRGARALLSRHSQHLLCFYLPPAENLHSLRVFLKQF
jgi:hypothetical protein